MKNRYDAVIVGAGPAGATAAYVLASAGLRAALVDKEIFPRPKVCGGSLSGRAKEIFEAIYSSGWDEAIEGVSSGFAFYRGGRLLNRVTGGTPLYFTSRSSFDSFLVHKAQKAGADFLPGRRVFGVDAARCLAKMENGDALRGDFIVGADGINSPVARSLLGTAFPRARLAVAVAAILPRQALLRDVDVPEIHFGIARWGYAWAFPGAHTVNVGVAGLWRKNKKIRITFEKFLAKMLKVTDKAAFRGHMMPFGSYLKHPGRGRVLLAGDAAGLVEPITGEGIHFAMESGRRAAEAVIEAATQGRPFRAADLYTGKIRPIMDVIDQARHLRPLIYGAACERILCQALARPMGKSLIRSHLALLGGEITYPDYTRKIARNLARGLVRLLVP